MRRIPALLGAAALLAATLAGCTAAPGGGCTPVYSSGDASSIVTASGKVDTEPKIDFPTPLVAKTTQVSTIHAGKGTVIASGAQVGFHFSVEYAKDASTFGTSGYDASKTPLISAGLKGNSISKALECAQVGDRLAIVTTMKATGDFFTAFSADAVSTVDPKEVLVMVIDVVLTYPGKSEGVNQLPRDGMPTVVTAVDGTPGIQVPPQSPPKKTEISTIKAGSGSVVKKGDNVVVEFSIWTWPTIDGDAPSVVTSSWDGKTARTLPVDATQLPKGIVDALEGERIGSQVLVVIPPGKDSFQDGQLQGVDSTSTVIMVIDLLGKQK